MDRYRQGTRLGHRPGLLSRRKRKSSLAGSVMKEVRLIMKRCKLLSLTVFVVLVSSCATREQAGLSDQTTEIDAQTRLLLEKINSAGAYKVPDLGLRKEYNYAKTAQDVEPFRHVKPHKEHFLLQMEYTGPGRGIPEPEDVNTVKIGFIGPIMSTVSVATGGKSHEEALGIKMVQGPRLAIEQDNAAGGE